MTDDAYCIIIENNIDYVDCFVKYFAEFLTIQSQIIKNYIMKYMQKLSNPNEPWLLVNPVDVAFRYTQEMFESFYY